ncbi:hypothetical protein Plec18167_006813 [Paecilomyces lecythidis]|uniref:Uncharacterized protein n=1 Tax=Paecilomyces lecythidis TaxID=3004212 RepID=A0ABR3X8Q5_9EURO
MARFSIAAAFMLLAAMSSALPTAGNIPGVDSFDKAFDEASNAASEAIKLQESPAPSPSPSAAIDGTFATPTPTPFGLVPSSSPSPSPSPASNPLAELPVVGPLAAALLGSGGQ